MKGRIASNAPRNRLHNATQHEVHVVLVPAPIPVPAGKHQKPGGKVQGGSVKPRLDKRARGDKLPLHRDLGGFIGKVPTAGWLGLAGTGLDMMAGAKPGQSLGTGAAIGRLVRGSRGFAALTLGSRLPDYFDSSDFDV